MFITAAFALDGGTLGERSIAGCAAGNSGSEVGSRPAKAVTPGARSSCRWR
jgi:hypothetical protein